MAAAKQIGEATPRILVVDDDADVVATLAQWLGHHGYAVDTAADGAEALDRVATARPDLVLLDLGLPDIDGLAVAGQLRGSRRAAHMPIVFMTARRGPKTRIACFEAGADDYVSKPFDFDEIDSRLRAVLRKKELHDELERANRALRRANRTLRRLLVTDEKTKLYTYRYVKERIVEEFKRAVRYRNALSCIMVDLDHFKEINDTLGHRAGDRVLEEFGRVLTISARETDLVARYGGDEFILVLPHTDSQQASMVAERIRRGARGRTFATEEPAALKLQVSCGVATFPANPHIRCEEDLVRVADEALYAAKNAGRNRIVIDPASQARRTPRRRRDEAAD